VNLLEMKIPIVARVRLSTITRYVNNMLLRVRCPSLEKTTTNNFGQSCSYYRWCFKNVISNLAGYE